MEFQSYLQSDKNCIIRVILVGKRRCAFILLLLNSSISTVRQSVVHVCIYTYMYMCIYLYVHIDHIWAVFPYLASTLVGDENSVILKD